MKYLNTETVCAMTGVLPTTLKNWKRAGLITRAEDLKRGYSWSQYIRINHILVLTSRGDTLREIYNLIYAPRRYHHSGWSYRQEELLMLLSFADDVALDKYLRRMMRDYSSEDCVNYLLKPLNVLLHEEHSPGSALRKALFHRAVMQQALRDIQAIGRQKAAPLFLEAVSVNDENEIWLEAIRLTGLGFRVEVSPQPAAMPAVATRRYEHHFMWCGAGISKTMKRYFQQRLAEGEPIMLCGPDKSEHA
ncbi:MerR family transcriptional regulator [Franconibacter daqui]|uniref:MerR family transcriptional regulator n=1 Tax=Franconibacter daqui TaxID=2047724 RepID=A0ABV1PHW8_9ENTR|nr:MerR family transcriptional regulator [Franconibacter daqui]MEB5920867.1 MerR family transcriptional regulator [Franconibacter daqui]